MSELTAAEWTEVKARHGRRAERFDRERTARLVACKPRKAQPLDPSNRDVCDELARSSMLPAPTGIENAAQLAARRKARNRLKTTRRRHRA